MATFFKCCQESLKCFLKFYLALCVMRVEITATSRSIDNHCNHFIEPLLFKTIPGSDPQKSKKQNKCLGYLTTGSYRADTPTIWSNKKTKHFPLSIEYFWCRDQGSGKESQ